MFVGDRGGASGNEYDVKGISGKNGSHVFQRPEITTYSCFVVVVVVAAVVMLPMKTYFRSETPPGLLPN